MQAALTRYRVIAWIVGTFLIVLVFVAMPLKYIGGHEEMSAIISPVHGFCYMVYLVLTFDLARRVDWPIWPKTLLVMLAGTIPVLSFVVERRVTRELAAARPETELVAQHD